MTQTEEIVHEQTPEEERRAVAGAMRRKTFFALFLAAAFLFLASLVMTVVSAILSNRTMSLGLDLNAYNVVKMATGEEDIRVAGTQEGELFAFDERGELLWNVGKLNEKAVYDLVVTDKSVYAVYADGTVYSFLLADAKSYSDSEEDDRTLPYIKYNSPYSIVGNVTNTQLIVSENEEALFLRAVFNDGRNRYSIFRFAKEGNAELIKQASGTFPIGGMALRGDVLYYAYRSGVYSTDGGSETELLTLDETIVALSASEEELSLVTQGNMLLVYSFAEGQTVYNGAIRTALDGAYVFSTGENFLAKIKNGGVAKIDTQKRGVTLTMAASDSCNFILWNDDCFMLRDTANIENPEVIFYSESFAASVALFATLVWVFFALSLVFLVCALVFFFAIRESTRNKMIAGVKAIGIELWRKKTIYLSLIIPFALLITFYYVPIIFGFSLSFLDYVPGAKSVFVGFKNFTAVLTDQIFWNSVGSMLIFLLADIVKAILPPLFIAELIFAAKSKRFSLWIRILLFIPGILPGVATTLIWAQGIFGATENSLMNAFLGLFVPGFVKNWVNSASYATRMCSIIAFGLPWIGSYLIFYGALGGINNSIFEAARLDGCSWGRRIVTIDIPLILPQIKYIFITSFIASVQNYATLYILYGAESGALIKTPALLIYGEIMNGNYGVASVMGLLLFVFLGVVMALNFRSQKEQIS